MRRPTMTIYVLHQQNPVVSQPLVVVNAAAEPSEDPQCADNSTPVIEPVTTSGTLPADSDSDLVQPHTQTAPDSFQQDIPGCDQ